MTDHDDAADVDELRRVLARALTLAGVDELCGWAPGTASKQRARLPQPDAYAGRTPMWARSTIERWRAARPGRGRRSDLTRTETDG